MNINIITTIPVSWTRRADAIIVYNVLVVQYNNSSGSGGGGGGDGDN